MLSAEGRENLGALQSGIEKMREREAPLPGNDKENRAIIVYASMILRMFW